MGLRLSLTQAGVASPIFANYLAWTAVGLIGVATMLGVAAGVAYALHWRARQGVSLTLPIHARASQMGLDGLSGFFRQYAPALKCVSKYDRWCPPFSLVDTVGKDRPNVYNSYEDAAIIEVHNLQPLESYHGVLVRRNEHNLFAIQQSARRGCTAAATAMLIADQGCPVDCHRIKMRNLGNTDCMRRDLELANLRAIVTEVLFDVNFSHGQDSLEVLRKLINAQGSAIVSVDAGQGGHVVVVDRISDDLQTVRLRDPAHGWDITLHAQSFLESWEGGNIIQVARPMLQ